MQHWEEKPTFWLLKTTADKCEMSGKKNWQLLQKTENCSVISCFIFKQSVLGVTKIQLVFFDIYVCFSFWISTVTTLQKLCIHSLSKFFWQSQKKEKVVFSFLLLLQKVFLLIEEWKQHFSKWPFLKHQIIFLVKF